jgi:hypothetical protein
MKPLTYLMTLEHLDNKRRRHVSESLIRQAVQRVGHKRMLGQARLWQFAQAAKPDLKRRKDVGGTERVPCKRTLKDGSIRVSLFLNV